ncbi:hypothetical protein ACPPTR_09045 [Ralstonia pseudosolanacearum]|uniref:Uncharacterized protein n=1 Tax=Ralstonia syzygii TaxID=28097 RepID=A0ABX7ZER8_9RALS|nr:MULTISPECIES: hypothetical protein [Ralstonia solanacearum species complex]MCD9228632.1 hypothetical protein [Ralstonia pseudosolanacearum]QUP53571.1 hypothetical protein GO998_07230 [Ralstonia syzygii]
MNAKNAVAAVLLAASGVAVAQTVPAIPSNFAGGVQPGPVTPDDPLPAKLIAVDPKEASFVAEYNAKIEAFYNEMTTYYTVINGYCIATPMTRKVFFLITRR